MRGYKVFNSDFTCGNFQYEIGETYELKGKLEMCKNGFHFCAKTVDCFKYYDFDSNNKVAEIEAIGDVLTEENKSITNKIHIIKELTWHEVLELVNTGKYNSGLSNSGNRNSGNWNSGNSNSGDSNSGDRNSGDCNSGYRNSGDWNSGNYSSGGFCIEKNPKIKIFDKESNYTTEEWQNSQAYGLLRRMELTEWINIAQMTDEEKQDHSEYNTLGGYLKEYKYKEACKNMWNVFTVEDKQIIKTIPNFDAIKFEEITGIRV